MRVIKIKGNEGLRRVLNAVDGMTFIVDKFTDRAPGLEGRVAHVRDYRYSDPGLGREFQIWSIGPDGYDEITQ